MRDNSKIIKRVVTIVVTVLMVSIIIGSLCFILYTNRLLPQGFLEYIDAVKNDTGFVPEVDFKTGINNTISWLREAG